MENQRSWQWAFAFVLLAMLVGAGTWWHLRPDSSLRSAVASSPEPSLDHQPEPKEPASAVSLASPTVFEARLPVDPVDAAAPDLETLLTQDARAALERVRAMQPEDDGMAQRLKWTEVRALVRLGKIGEARDQAGNYYERWPQGPDIPALHRLTGLHPVPSPDQDR